VEKSVLKRNILILMIKDMGKKMKVVMTKVFPIPTLCLELMIILEKQVGGLK
jgi:hypothetical protein